MITAMHLWHQDDLVARMAARLESEALQLALREPLLARMSRAIAVAATVGDTEQWSLSAMLAHVLGGLLKGQEIGTVTLVELIRHTHASSPELVSLAVLDIEAVLQRDPATESALSVLLYQKGFHAIQLHRVINVLWGDGRKDLALYLQSLSSRILGVDIHPACRIGHSVMFDHATGIVAGETCVIGDEVSVMQGVTLGGTGKERGDRHPKIFDGVLIGAGAVLLGNIVVHRGAKIGAGSVVLADVPACTTVAGIPARVVGTSNSSRPSGDMDQMLPESATPTRLQSANRSA